MKSKASELSDWIRENYPILDSNKITSRKKRYGVGINDSDYVTKPTIGNNRLVCPAYKGWYAMITRAYSPNYHERQPTYKGVTVCNEWLIFSNFRSWFMDNHIDNYHLDKDLLVINNRLYSPETCIYLPRWLNSFTSSHAAKRGDCLVGANFYKPNGKFVAQCCNPITKKIENLGYFKTDSEAHSVWLTRKLEIALELKPKMDTIDLRIYPNVVEIIKNMK